MSEVINVHIKIIIWTQAAYWIKHLEDVLVLAAYIANEGHKLFYTSVLINQLLVCCGLQLYIECRNQSCQKCKYSNIFGIIHSAMIMICSVCTTNCFKQ